MKTTQNFIIYYNIVKILYNVNAVNIHYYIHE
jgi:hypothetical protein